jgi:hypothetical protein
MKFWLACFGLLFVGAELFQWMVQLSWQFSGSGLILGGMGLALASNAAHLPKSAAVDKAASASSPGAEAIAAHQTVTQQTVTQQTVTQQTVTQQTAQSSRPLDQAAPNPSNQDSISFKVRLPWR